MTSEVLEESGQSRFPGHDFRQARERAGFELEIVAREMHLTLKVLELIESGHPEKFHNPVFMRGYIRSYARKLHLPADRYVQLFEQVQGERLQPRVPRSTSSVSPREPERSHLLRIGSWIFVIALLAVIVWWSREQYGLSPAVDVPQPAVVQISEPEQPEAVMELDELPQDFPHGSDALLEGDDAMVETVNGASEVPEAVNEAPAFMGLVMHFSDECWLDVRGAGGQRIYSGLARAGTELELEGAEPIQVEIGRVSAVSHISYRGEKINLAPLATNNVARFQLPRP